MTLRAKPDPLPRRVALRAPHSEAAAELVEAVRPRQAPPTPTLASIAQMRLRTLPYTRMDSLSERRRMDISHMEHNAIVSAILRREPEMAYHAMRLPVIDAGHVEEDRPAPRPYGGDHA
jgi:hypothetical protein